MDPPSTDRDEYLTAAGLAELLQLSVRSIDRMLASGDLPQPLRLGGSRRWSRAEVMEHLRNRRGSDAQEASQS